MAESRKCPMPSGNLSQGDPYATAYPVNRKRESDSAPGATGARKQTGTLTTKTSQSGNKVDADGE
jgi:hypothetical protein